MKRDMDSIILTRQELQIMKVVWDLGSATVKDVCSTMSRQKKTAYTTVLTLMGILEDKGALVHQRNGRAFNYRPMLSRAQATQNQIRDLVGRFFDGKTEKMIEAIRQLECVDRHQAAEPTEPAKPREQHQVA